MLNKLDVLDYDDPSYDIELPAPVFNVEQNNAFYNQPVVVLPFDYEFNNVETEFADVAEYAEADDMARDAERSNPSILYEVDSDAWNAECA